MINQFLLLILIHLFDHEFFSLLLIHSFNHVYWLINSIRSANDCVDLNWLICMINRFLLFLDVRVVYVTANKLPSTHPDGQYFSPTDPWRGGAGGSFGPLYLDQIFAVQFYLRLSTITLVGTKTSCTYDFLHMYEYDRWVRREKMQRVLRITVWRYSKAHSSTCYFLGLVTVYIAFCSIHPMCSMTLWYQSLATKKLWNP